MIQTTENLENQDNIKSNKNGKSAVNEKSGNDFLSLVLASLGEDGEEIVNKSNMPIILGKNLDNKNKFNNTTTNLLKENNPKINNSNIFATKDILQNKTVQSKLQLKNMLISEKDINDIKVTKDLNSLIKVANTKGLNVQNVKFEQNGKEVFNSKIDSKINLKSVENLKNNINLKDSNKNATINTKAIIDLKNSLSNLKNKMTNTETTKNLKSNIGGTALKAEESVFKTSRMSGNGINSINSSLSKFDNAEKKLDDIFNKMNQLTETKKVKSSKSDIEIEKPKRNLTDLLSGRDVKTSTKKETLKTDIQTNLKDLEKIKSMTSKTNPKIDKQENSTLTSQSKMEKANKFLDMQNISKTTSTTSKEIKNTVENINNQSENKVATQDVNKILSNKVIQEQKQVQNSLEKNLNEKTYLEGEKLTEKLKEQLVIDKYAKTNHQKTYANLNMNLNNNTYFNNNMNNKVKDDKIASPLTSLFSKKKVSTDEITTNVAKKKELKNTTLNSLKLSENNLDIANNQVDKLQDKIGKAKVVMKNFASDLKLKMDDYKAPMMKFALTLRPGNLGDVNVTILKRGNNLQVSIGSNQSALQMLAQNSTEFKNALSSLGLNDIQVNFNLGDGERGGNDGQNQSNQQQNQQQNRGFKEYADIEDKIDELESIDLTVPQYV